MESGDKAISGWSLQGYITTESAHIHTYYIITGFRDQNCNLCSYHTHDLNIVLHKWHRKGALFEMKFKKMKRYL